MQPSSAIPTLSASREASTIYSHAGAATTVTVSSGVKKAAKTDFMDICLVWENARLSFAPYREGASQVFHVRSHFSSQNEATLLAEASYRPTTARAHSYAPHEGYTSGSSQELGRHTHTPSSLTDRTDIDLTDPDFTDSLPTNARSKTVCKEDEGFEREEASEQAEPGIQADILCASLRRSHLPSPSYARERSRAIYREEDFFEGPGQDSEDGSAIDKRLVNPLNIDLGSSSGASSDTGVISSHGAATYSTPISESHTSSLRVGSNLSLLTPLEIDYRRRLLSDFPHAQAPSQTYSSRSHTTVALTSTDSRPTAVTLEEIDSIVLSTDSSATAPLAPLFANMILLEKISESTHEQIGKVKDQATGRMYAIRKIPVLKPSIAIFLERAFLKERLLLQQLSHPCLISAHQMRAGDSCYEILMDLGPTTPLKTKAGLLSQEELKLVAGRLVHFLSYLESKEIIHSHVCLDNVLIDSSLVIKVIGLDSAIKLEEIVAYSGITTAASESHLSESISPSTPWRQLGELLYQLAYTPASPTAISATTITLPRAFYGRQLPLDHPIYPPTLANFIEELLNLDERTHSYSERALTHPYFRHLDWRELFRTHGTL